MLGDVTYNSCTRIGIDDNDIKAWCSVEVDNSSKLVSGQWGYCEPACQPDWCLTEENKCIGTRSHEKGKIQSNKTHLISFDARTEAPCIFPFKLHLDHLHHSCTRESRKYIDGRLELKPWCATSVNENLEMKNWGYCSENCPNEDIDWLTIIGVTISICFLLVSILIVFCYYAKRYKGKEGEGSDTIMNGNIGMLNSCMILNEQAAHLSYSGEKEIDRSKFEIGRKLGDGNFGSVHEGIAEDLIFPGQKIKVAIKSVNNPLDPAEVYSLLCEIKILDQLENRLDLVNMIGACTTHFKSGKIWLILEYCSHGDMKSFLLKNRDVISRGLNHHTVPHETLNIRLFIKWSHSICKGMDYLASKNIMHGDLAARNILICKHENDKSYLAKIGDFGLSKAFCENASYLKQERKNIPWKWMAVDYFETEVLTLSSDAWSFGVVFWEMLSFGQLPYAGRDAVDTIKEIKAGFRLPVPDEVKETNWLVKCYNDVTKMCWQLDPNQRCSFSDLVKTFETYLTSEEKENYERLEQSVIESQTKMSKGGKPKHGLSNGAVALNENIADDNYMKSVSIRAKQ